MDQTPRLRSAFPATPPTNRRSTASRFNAGDSNFGRQSAPIPTLQTLRPKPSEPSDPLIPEHILDAPTQRLLTVSFFILLWAWRIWDFLTLVDTEEQSLWLFMKWIAIDGVCLFGLPALRIPWLEWSPSTMTLAFCIHAFVDGMLMFRIPIPIFAGLSALGRSVYGAYEMAVNEHSVNPEHIKFNESLILGRQVVHILPEGSAVLNAEKKAFCIDSSRPEVELPITINATEPIAMELLRVDLDKDHNETIHISKSQIKSMHNAARRLLTYSDDPNKEKTLYYGVKKPGLYVLAKVVDKSNLEVSRKRLAHTVVANCPKAAVKPSSSNRCKGELSNVEFEVTGAPPLSIKYHKYINHQRQEGTIENILPSEDFSSPLAGRGQSSLVIPAKMDRTWAKSQPASISVSEALSAPGQWLYSIDEVRDAFGNPTEYSSRAHENQQKNPSKTPPLRQAITVHERPTVNLRGCTTQNPLKVAKGQSAHLPVQVGSAGGSKGEIPGAPYRLDVKFTPQNDITSEGEHAQAAQMLRMDVKEAKQLPAIKEPGLYSISGVSTDFCQGEVLEPASCPLENPPQPKLSISKEEIFDKCAGSPVGLRVDLDLIGTPPFKVHYTMQHGSHRHHTGDDIEVKGLRGQIDLTPHVAGHYTYEFVKISDAVYKEQKLSGLSLEQDVKPSASAKFINSGARTTSCIDDTAKFAVALQGELPFTLEYELVHNGKRAKFTRENITTRAVDIETEPLVDGGEYTLALASVTDVMGCQEFLQDQVTINVRHQRPKVSFRTIDGKRAVSALEGKQVDLPLRLEGDAPWTVKYLDTNKAKRTVKVQNPNDKVTVSDAGSYELFDVDDNTCPGVVDEAAKSFDVSWIRRPEMRVRGDDIEEQKANKFIKRDVCEGDEDSAELLFQGTPPFDAHYIQHSKPQKGTMAPKNKEVRATSHVSTLRMDTHQAGVYTYEFNKLGDLNYKSPANFKPITLQQRVNQRPSAAFTTPGKTYSFCSVESDGEEVIPITLHGQPPFDLEVEIKHHGTSRPETVSLTHITTKSHNIRIPHSRLHLGKSAVSLRRVSDSRGCARLLDGSRVQISVHDAPTITELESHADFCVGDRINFALSGTPPFNVLYDFEGASRTAVVGSTTFRRFAEYPGTFTITGLSDSGSTCKSSTNITKHIRSLPSVRVSHGKEGYVDIHEGGEAEILFEFSGEPPFEFTYTRSSNTERHGKKPGTVLDMRSEVSEGYSMRVMATQEGTYEVVSVKDKHCGYTRQGWDGKGFGAQKRIKN